MKHIYRYALLLGLISIFTAGCSDKLDTSFVRMQDLIVSDNFDWQSSRVVELDLDVLNNTGLPVPGIYFEIHDAVPSTSSRIVARGTTDDAGKFELSVNLPSRVKKLWAVGFMRTEAIDIVNNRASFVYGGVVPKENVYGGFEKPDVKNWSYLPGMTFNNNGVPSPMTTVPLEPDFLQRVNSILPERISVPEYNPQFLANDVQTNLKIDEPAEVWVTFVTEGAGFKNALGFYTYDTGNAPLSPAQVNPKTILFPNASLSGSGGSMQAGNTVYLGVFDPGTTIGWLLVADGFISGSNVSTSKPVYYSDKDLNPETNPAKKQHSILVYDAISGRLLVGFEDLPRGNGSDDDFNDLVFFVTVNPIEAVDLDDVPVVAIPEDRDGDGISDILDDYPDDPELAFDNYTYGYGSWGTLAFEDLWPDFGDYDFNDLVIDYNYNQITQPGNRVKKVEMHFKLKAIGARKQNGFAVQLPFPSSNIENVVPLHPALFDHETDGPKAVFRFFNSAFDLMPQTAGFINTEMNDSYYQPVEFGVSFYLTNPVAVSTISPTPPYNPFIFVNLDRSHEIHMPDYPPTTRMNMSLFGTGNDDSVPSANRYYKSNTNLPWVLNIPEMWQHPVERAQLTNAYRVFKHWVQSNGNSYTDWYLNLPGYRSYEYIYQTP